MILLISACIAFFLVFPVYLIVETVEDHRRRKTREWETLQQIAIDRGHVVTAELVHIQANSVRTSTSFSNHDSMGIYKYVYNGKRYRYTFQSDDPKPTMTLYFLDNPRKATVGRALKRKGVSWPIVYAIVLGIVYWLMCTG